MDTEMIMELELEMECVNKILEQYDIEAERVELLRHNENKTYRVYARGGDYVLRIHQPVDTMNLSLLRAEKSQQELIEGEMLLLAQLAVNDGLGTQLPIRNKAGSYVTRVENIYGNIYATMISWVAGACISKADFSPERAMQLGKMLAAVHNCLDSYSYNTEKRYCYDAALVERLQERLHTFCGGAALPTRQYDIMEELLQRLHSFLQEEERNKNMRIVHNDLGESNFIYNENGFIPIDFSMSGLCVREMDLASLFCHFENKELREGILQGYMAGIGHTGKKIEKSKIYLCIGFQLMIFLLSQYENICQAPWFSDMLGYWCEEVFQPIINGEAVEAEIGLYS